MPDLQSASPSPAGTGEGIAPAGGQALGPPGTAPEASVSTLPAPSEQPRAPAEPAEKPQPAGESVPGWKTLEDAARDYKEIQRAYTRATQLLGQLGDPDAIQQERALLAELRNNPEFVSWVEQQIAQQQVGNADPDTMRALQVIDQRAHQIAQSYVAPLQAAALEQKAEAVFAAMDQKHGAEWTAMRPRMREILQQGQRQGIFAPSVETNFDLAFVDGLYSMAVGADPEFAATQYQKRLAQKQAQTTTREPGTAPAAVGTGSARSFEEAYQQARQQLGLSG